ncbi:MAG: head GIN domain-containing protein [Pseudomonadota bacterium]
MRTLFFAGAGAAALLTGAALADDDVTETLDLTGFDKIDIAGVMELDVTVGEDYAIEMQGPADEIERVEASVKDGVLKLKQRDRKKKGFGWGGNREGIDVTISLPSLTALEISGVVDGDIRNVDTESFELDVSGVGDIDIAGVCGNFDADVSGVGDLDAKALECRDVEIDVSGVGDATVYASEAVDASVSGMGEIDIYGSPDRVEKNKSLFADITVH